MVSAHAHTGDVDNTLRSFNLMPEWDAVACNSVLMAFQEAGRHEDLKSVFLKLPCRNISSWNSLLQSYALRADVHECSEILQRMPAHDTTSKVLSCMALSRSGQEELSELRSSSSKITSLANIGDVKRAREEAGVSNPNPVPYNSMLAYTLNGDVYSAAELFMEMNLQGVKPNRITFLTILLGCRDKGTVTLGYGCFASMVRDFDVQPEMEHYFAIVDMLGRAKQVASAEELVRNMPFLPDSLAWSNLLGACTTAGDVEQAEGYVRELDASPYVLLPNIYVQDASCSV